MTRFSRRTFKNESNPSWMLSRPLCTCEYNKTAKLTHRLNDLMTIPGAATAASNDDVDDVDASEADDT